MRSVELNRDLSLRNARRATAIAIVINIVGMALESAIEKTVPDIPSWPPMMSAGIGVLLLIILGWRRKTIGLLPTSALYLVNASVITLALLVTNPYFAATGSHWVPFQAAKLGCLIAGFLAPTLGAGLIAITLHGGLSVVQYAMFSSEIKAGLSAGEPWATIAFMMTGMALIWFRTRREEVERDLIQMQVEADAVKDLAHTFLQLRDMMNTPIQTIALTVEVLKEKNPDKSLERIERALEKLRDINLVLIRHEEKLVWKPEDLALGRGKG